MRLLIVNYHYIRDIHSPKGIFPITTKNFKNQLNIISKYYKFVSQQELVDFIKKDSFPNNNYCLITFDDGLKEQMNALQILNKLSIPAVFFVTTQPHIDKTAHDVHKFHYVFSKFEDKFIYQVLQEKFKIDEYSFDQKLLKEEYRYDKIQKRKIKFFINFVLDPSKRKRLLKMIFNQLQIKEEKFVKDLYLDIEEIKKISSLGMLGTHTYSHRPLSILNEIDQTNEIRDSRIFLEKITKSKIQGISYPYGGPGAINSKVSKIAENNGFDFGLTMKRGINQEKDLRNPLMLKRIDTNEAPGGKLNSKEYIP